MSKSSNRKSSSRSRRSHKTARQTRKQMFECLERRELMAIDVPFSIMTQNMQLRPSSVWEADPDGALRALGLGISFAGGPIAATLVKMGKELAEDKYAERVPNTAADNAERANLLLTKAASYDIVALQEVFDPDQVRQLANGAQRSQYSYLSGPGPDSLSETLDAGLLGDLLALLPGREPRVGWDSGLGTLVRNQIASGPIEHHAIEFEQEGSGGDEFANKGFTVDGITLGLGKVFVINTHLSAADPFIRPAQLQQIRRFMNTLDPRYPVLLVGDINLRGEEAKAVSPNGAIVHRVNEDIYEYQTAMSILGRLDDPFRESFLQSNLVPEGWDRFYLSNYANQYWTSDAMQNAYKYLWGGKGTFSTVFSQLGLSTSIPFAERHLDKSRIDHIWIRQGSEFGIDVDSIKLENSSPASSYILQRISAELASIDARIAVVNEMLTQLPGDAELTSKLSSLQDERSVVSQLVPYFSDHFGLSARLRLYKYVDFDANTGMLRLMGARGERDDTFVARRDGNDLVVTHTFDSHSFETRVPYDQVRQITGFGRAGNDTITIDDSVAIPAELQGGSGDDTLKGGSVADVVLGNAGNDSLNGGGGNDTLFGGAGDDTLTGDAGDDTLHGDEGADKLYGSAGVDTLHGGDGDDSLSGGTGDDVLVGGAGADQLDGGLDNDRIQYDLSSFSDRQIDVPKGGPGVDAIEIVGSEGDDHIEMRRVSPGTYSITAFQNGTVIASHLIELAPRPEDRDLETIRISGLGGVDTLDAAGESDLYELTLDGGLGNDTIRGSDARDLIFGGLGNDAIDGGAGNDTIYGESEGVLQTLNPGSSQANDGDTISGGQGIDTIHGGTGDDYIVGGLGTDFLHGGAHHDTIDSSDDRDGDVIWGDEGDDQLKGGSGSDVIRGGDQNDTITGGDTRDILFGENHDDLIVGGGGLDFIEGGDGNDTLYGQHPTDGRATEAELATNLREFEDLSGGNGADRIHGSDLRDRIDGGEGADIVFHSSGQDVVTAGGGPLDQYRFEGSDGVDVISLAFRAGTTALVVSINGNLLDVPSGFHVVGVDGKGDNDTFTTQLGLHATVAFELIGGEGNDTMDMSTMQSDVTLHGGGGNDTLYGGASRTTAHGGDGVDHFVRQVRDGDVKVVYRNGKLVSDQGGQLSYLKEQTTGFETLEVLGTPKDDFVDLTDFNGNVTIRGGAGNDRLNGSHVGNDTIDGGVGDDVLQGNGGNDAFNGGLGNDELYESRQFASQGVVIVAGNGTLTGVGTDSFSGVDTVRLVGSDFGDRLDASRFAGRATLLGLGGGDVLVGSAFADTLDGGAGGDSLYGNDGDDRLDGNSGDDFVEGGLGNDILRGGDGADRLYGLSVSTTSLSASQLSQAGRNYDSLEGGEGDDTLVGGLGNDRLYGGNGRDVLDGRAGNDYLDGGREVERDALIGGAGRDTFVWWTPTPQFGAHILLDNFVDYIASEDVRERAYLVP